MTAVTEVCNDVVFLIEGTSSFGVYANEIKANYIEPTVEHFNGGPVVDCCHSTFETLYSLVVYHSAESLQSASSLVDVCGPFRNPKKFLELMDNLDYSGGYRLLHHSYLFLLFKYVNKNIFFLQVLKVSMPC